MDIVSRLQDEFIAFTETFSSLLEAVPQAHVPPPAPAPPPGIDPNLHYQRYWAHYLQQHPFDTRGFIEGSDEAADDTERWKHLGGEIRKHYAEIERLLEYPVLDRSKQEQQELLKNLSDENDAAEKELQETVKEAEHFIQELRQLYKRVAREYIQI